MEKFQDWKEQTDTKKLSFETLLHIWKESQRNNTSLKDFAEAYDLPYRTVQNWASGIRQPPDYVLSLLLWAMHKDWRLTENHMHRLFQKETSPPQNTQ